MRRAAEFAISLGLAAGLHLAVAALAPRAEGVQSAGQGGEAAVSLQAASEQISALVAEWDTPPETAAQTPPDMPAPAPEAAPQPAAAIEAPPSAALQVPGLAVPQTDAPPEPDIAPPVPRMDAEALARLSKIRPQARPPEPPEPAPAPPEPAARKPRPAPASQSSAAQQASGSGGGSNAGAAQDRGAATLSAGQRQSLFAQWGAQVRRKIERGKRYPASARGASGTVQVSLTVGRDGSLRAVSVAASSGHAALDEAALQAVRSAQRFPAAPVQLTDPSYTFTLAMQFSS